MVFHAIAERHLDAIHRYLQRRVGYDLADDLAAETFALAFSSRLRYRAEFESALPWLYGIAANALRGHKRTEQRRLRAQARLRPGPHLGPDADELDARLDAGAAWPMMAGALLQLNPHQREVLLLFAWAELSYEEIAQALSISVGTVRSRLSRARTTVAGALAEAGIDQDTPDPPMHATSTGATRWMS
jgi:RNA polymerase sigma-70 factor (ECF subfamily)